jgi:hypothetical protein
LLLLDLLVVVGGGLDASADAACRGAGRGRGGTFLERELEWQVFITTGKQLKKGQNKIKTFAFSSVSPFASKPLKLLRAAIVTSTLAACFYWRELLNNCR